MAWIKTGTVSLTNGSTNVVGTGTTWLTQVGPSDVFIDPNGVIYEIASVQSGTQLTLAAPYAGVTNATASYKIFPTQAYNLQVATAANNMIATFQPLLEAQLSSEVFLGRFPSGTIAGPGIAFSTQVGTGLSLTAGNDLAVSVGGSEALRIASGTRNVSIGTAAISSRPLEVGGSTRAIIRATVSSTIGTDALAGMEFYAYDGTANTVGGTLTYSYSLQSVDPNYLKINNIRNGGIAFSTNNTEKVRILPSGNVGLGVVNPLSTLHVNGDIRTNNAQYIYTSTSTLPTRILGINATNTFYVGTIDAAHSNTLIVNGGVQQMQITSAGNFDFGSSAPTGNFAQFQKNQNAPTELYVYNNDTVGTAAFSSVGSSDGGTNSIRMISFGSGYTGIAGLAGRQGIFLAPSKDFFVWVNGVQRMQLKTGGTLHLGTGLDYTTPVTGAIPMINVGNASKAVVTIRGAATADPAAGGVLALQRTASASTDILTTTGAADTIGVITADGVNSTNVIASSSRIVMAQDGAAGTNVPGKVVIQTASSTAAPTDKVTVTSAGRVGIMTGTPGAVLDVASGNAPTILAGADSGGTTRTNVTTKVARFAVPHYTNAELPFGFITGISNSTENLVELGGNTASLNAANAIRMYTGTVRTGGTLPVERVRITGDGKIGYNIVADPVVDYEFSKVGTAAATSVRLENQTDASYGQIQYIGSTFATADRQNNLEILTGGASSGITFSPGNATFAAHFTSAGRFIHGAKVSYPGQMNGSFDAPIQTHSTSASGYLASRWSVTAAAGAGMNFTRSRGAAVGTHAAVVSGDYYGYISFSGSDGTAFREGARITSEVGVGTVSATSMPGSIVFWTSANGSVTPTERARIDQDGEFLIGRTTPVGTERLAVVGSVRTHGTGGGAVHFSRDAIPVSGNGLGATYFEGRTDATTYQQGASIIAIAPSTWTTTSAPAELSLRTTNTGSVTPTEKVRINQGGNVLVGVATENAAGGILQLNGGITFPAIPVESSNANTLDDYEEGTFTPTIAGTTTSGTGTYSEQNGFYTKIGNRVSFSIRITWSAHTGTGNLAIGALPFTSNAAGRIHAVSVGSQNLTFTGQLVAYVNQGATTITFGQMASGVVVTGVPIDTAADIWVSGTYHV